MFVYLYVIYFHFDRVIRNSRTCSKKLKYRRTPIYLCGHVPYRGVGPSPKRGCTMTFLFFAVCTSASCLFSYTFFFIGPILFRVPSENTVYMLCFISCFFYFIDTAMTTFTVEENIFLSYLLDDVVGTEEIVTIRQDYCRIYDCLVSSNILGTQFYFTGSKAEGLNLAGSDEDFMYDIDTVHDIYVSESIQVLSQSSHTNKFFMVTDNVKPGFALLKAFGEIKDALLLQTLWKVYKDPHLSSNMFVTSLLPFQHNEFPTKIQGPSLETWTQFCILNSQSGRDRVPSIPCKFWPSRATEWTHRPRHYGWPFLCDRNKIVTLGFHLVPVGHPLSAMKLMEWRISFSIAERILVWSFNHTQMQCYAFMKLLLKEFIKTRCSEKSNDVLCSYFIKTFLFWQYEETDPSFWQTKNMQGCINYLLREFYTCIQGGVLRHYFIPCFNLLEIKLTRDAQKELVNLLDIVLESDMAIMAQCPSLVTAWLKFQEGRDKNQLDIRELQNRQMLDSEEMPISKFYEIIIMTKTMQWYSSCQVHYPVSAISDFVDSDNGQTPLASLVIRHVCLLANMEQLKYSSAGNISVYQCLRVMIYNSLNTDIASSLLWGATFLLQMKEYGRALKHINKVLSSIPPYVLYCSLPAASSVDTKLYKDTIYSREPDILNRARKAWLFDIMITSADYQFMPRAIQIELLYSDPCFQVVSISPFTYAYYLMFLCYQGLGQYENRDCALRELVDTVNSAERCSIFRHNSLNIAAHCLLLAEQADAAQNLLLKSIHFTHILGNIIDKNNSAYQYLSNM